MSKNNVSIQNVTQQITSVFIYGPVEEPEDYVEEVKAIREATGVLNVHINTPGGRVDTACSLVSALEDTQAQTVGYIEGVCHSAGTILALTCDALVVYDHSLMMFHSASQGGWGKGEDPIVALKAQDAWIKRIMRDKYKDFLTPTEIEYVLDAKDLWLEAEDIRIRWDRVLKARAIEEESQKKELIDQITSNIHLQNS